jgi:hypothetical protein
MQQNRGTLKADFYMFCYAKHTRKLLRGMHLFCRKIQQNRNTPQGYFYRSQRRRNLLACGLYFVTFYDKIEATGEAIFIISTAV